MKPSEHKIAVLIPCYNESKTIRKVVLDFRKALPNSAIYVYDNNSTDDTVDVVKKLQSKCGCIFLCKEPRQGKGNVVRSMFRDIDADCYLLVDGDDTYPAESAQQMSLLVLEDNADMVIGDRLSTTYFSENNRKFHNAGNSIVRLLVNKLFHSDVKDIMTGYRAFSKSFVKNFPILSKGFEIETEMTIWALDKNFLIREVPINYRDRPEGSESKLNTFSDGFKVIMTIGRLFRDYRPFYLFTFLSLLLTLISLILFVPVFVEYIDTGIVPRFPTLIVSSFIMVIAVLFFFCGLVLEVISKKHKQLFEVLMNINSNE